MDKLFPSYEHVPCAYCSRTSILPPGTWISSCSKCETCLPLLRMLPSNYKYIMLQCNDTTTYVPVPANKSVYDCPSCANRHTIYFHCDFYISRRKVSPTSSGNQNQKAEDFSVNSAAQRILISFFALEVKVNEREEALREELEKAKKENEELKKNLEENDRIKKIVEKSLNNEDIVGMQRTLSMLKERLEQDFEEKNMENENLKGEINDLKEMINKLEEELKTEREHNNKLEEDLENEENQNDQLKKDLEIELEKTKKLSEELEKEKEAANVCMKELEHLSREMDATENEKIRLEKVVKEKDELIKFFQEEHKKMSSAIVFQMAYGVGGQREQKVIGSEDEQTEA